MILRHLYILEKSNLKKGKKYTKSTENFIPTIRMAFFNLQNTMETKNQEFSLSMFAVQTILVVVSILVVFIIAKLCYDKYKNTRFDEADSQTKLTLKHQQ
ncbi:hypothetical protein IMCC3317_14990 [Kordia antarctica]|uniref:Uncharacterized protein n=1 Tax=Kordia antarctica TaxID=1218801 RepID=A0A7L4ZHY9_9FLAO|nr:hypothetical protein [Kordia antarctica]QHI36140.1 hypothetical protein IMCC3317_14990 [Kordia antarctica]